jgi:hypothetical protein
MAFAPFAFSGSAISGFGELDDTRWYNYVLRDTLTFTPALVNDARMGFHRRAQPGVLPVNHTTPAQLGFTQINPDDSANAGPPWIVITGYSLHRQHPPRPPVALRQYAAICRHFELDQRQARFQIWRGLPRL